MAAALTALAVLTAARAGANDVRAGVEAWGRGDYAAAVAQWIGPANAADPDAMFNLAQAYRLGRGVPLDLAQAEQLYAQAAAAGHVQAADTYGLMLFQDGRREQALPYVEAAARRGDPRARYLLGVAHFNGDIVPRDWQRAYALLTLAQAAGLPQAASAIAEMDRHVPLAERQQAAALARLLDEQAEEARAVAFAAAELGTAAAQPQAQAAAAPAQADAAGARIPRPLANVPLAPSASAARAALDDARRADGTDSPAQAGASFAAAAPQSPPPQPPAQPARSAAPPSAAAPPPAPAPARAASSTAASGPWRVQLGAFSVRENAERLWRRLSGRDELAGRERLLVAAGNAVRLQAGGYASRAEAERACRSLGAAGIDCLVTRG